MGVLESFKTEWSRRGLYERFELVILNFLLLLISLMALYTTVLAVLEVARDFALGSGFLETEVLQDAFGAILTILILLELTHSIALAIRTHSGAVQVRVVVLIAILAVARKLILLDYKAASPPLLLALGGLALSLGALYWLLAQGERRIDRDLPGG
jgi:uncharacterized membrane protein (DUF373 family)